MDKYKITFETWNRVATDYQEKFMDLDLYNDTYDSFCVLAKQNSKVLEIGCGPGNISRYVLSKRPDLILSGIDISENMIKLASINNPGASFKVMDCRELDKINEKYCAIVCGFCMPYLSQEDCTKMIRDSHTLLNENGLFYFSVIEGNHARSGYEGSSNGKGKCFVYYYEEAYLRKELEKNNFEILILHKKNYPKQNENSTHLIFIARKK